MRRRSSRWVGVRPPGRGSVPPLASATPTPLSLFCFPLHGTKSLTGIPGPLLMAEGSPQFSKWVDSGILQEEISLLKVADCAGSTTFCLEAFYVNPHHPSPMLVQANQIAGLRTAVSEKDEKIRQPGFCALVANLCCTSP